jgi:hypothetical protein
MFQVPLPFVLEDFPIFEALEEFGEDLEELRSAVIKSTHWGIGE